MCIQYIARTIQIHSHNVTDDGSVETCLQIKTFWQNLVYVFTIQEIRMHYIFPQQIRQFYICRAITL